MNARRGGPADAQQQRIAAGAEQQRIAAVAEQQRIAAAEGQRIAAAAAKVNFYTFDLQLIYEVH